MAKWKEGMWKGSWRRIRIIISWYVMKNGERNNIRERMRKGVIKRGIRMLLIRITVTVIVVRMRVK